MNSLIIGGRRSRSTSPLPQVQKRHNVIFVHGGDVVKGQLGPRTKARVVKALELWNERGHNGAYRYDHIVATGARTHACLDPGVSVALLIMHELLVAESERPIKGGQLTMAMAFDTFEDVSEGLKELAERGMRYRSLGEIAAVSYPLHLLRIQLTFLLNHGHWVRTVPTSCQLSTKEKLVELGVLLSCHLVPLVGKWMPIPLLNRRIRRKQAEG